MTKVLMAAIVTAKEAQQAMEIVLLAEESAQCGQLLPISPSG